MQNGQKSSGFHRVLTDIVELCELQWQLMSVDGQEAKRRAVKGAVQLMIGLIVGLAGTFAAVLAAGWLLHDELGMPAGVAFAVVSGTAIAIAALASFLGVRLLRKANDSLSEAKQEFSENVRWIKQVVLQPSSPRNQFRHGDFSPELVDPRESRFQHYRQ